MKRCDWILGLIFLAGLSACPKKSETTGSTASSASASASTAAAPSASAAATDSASAQAAVTAPPPPSGLPGISVDPNTAPTHEDHDKEATATIHKANYKAELDKLEKEDLSK